MIRMVLNILVLLFICVCVMFLSIVFHANAPL